MEMKAGDLVWFKPKEIGYGYLYGLDDGIPASIVKVCENRVRIEFTVKGDTMIFRRYVSPRNLEPRRC